jgi:hypothetical protein
METKGAFSSRPTITGLSAADRPKPPERYPGETDLLA